MLRVTRIFIFLLLPVCLLSCKDEECHDIHYGELYLDPVSHTFTSGANTNAIIFKDSSGLDHRFELSTNVDFLRSDLRTDTCEGQAIFITYDSEYYLRRYSDQNNTGIAYAQVAGFLDEEQVFEEHRFVDILKLTIFDDNMPPGFVSRICIMTSDRGGSLDQDAYNANQFIQHDSLVLLNKTFYNVYEQKQGSPKMYYTSIDGVVSFTDNTGVELVLDRVE